MEDLGVNILIKELNANITNISFLSGFWNVYDFDNIYLATKIILTVVAV